jgi:sialate O-acetylesterase
MTLPWFAHAVSFPALLLISLTASAELRLPKVWSDHAVIQRDRPIHVWGWADVGERVTATLRQANGGAEETTSATADSFGHWSVYLAPRPAGGDAYTLTVSGGQMGGGGTLLVRDLLMGDVWLASGQSNMELPLLGFPRSAVLKNGPEEIKAANHPEIRLLHEPKRFSYFPMQDQEATWQICTPETAATFSAVAYFFAREIQHDQKIPVGVVEADWGGTPAESWTSLDTLGNDAALMPVFAERAADMDKQADAEVIKARYAQEDAAVKAAGRTPEEHPWQPPVEPWAASSLYNGMIAPVTPLGIRGVIWYQGEANTDPARALLYHRLFSSMIGDWRRQFAQGDFPFLFVQISSYATPEEDWGMVRDAQRRTLSVAGTGMAVSLDVGDRNNVHPADKQTVGHRLALAARALSYGEDIRHSGPLFRQAATEGGGMRVYFTGADGKLAVRGGTLDGFELAGANHHFVPATAKIDADGASVTVTSPQVATPEYVRYAWANAPDATLMDSAGLPASTFTSEAVPTPAAH